MIKYLFQSSNPIIQVTTTDLEEIRRLVKKAIRLSGGRAYTLEELDDKAAETAGWCETARAGEEYEGEAFTVKTYEPVIADVELTLTVRLKLEGLNHDDIEEWLCEHTPDEAKDICHGEGVAVSVDYDERVVEFLSEADDVLSTVPNTLD